MGAQHTLQNCWPNRDGVHRYAPPPRRPDVHARIGRFQVLHVDTRIADDATKDVALGEIGQVVHRSPHLMATLRATRNGWPEILRAAGSTAAISLRRTPKLHNDRRPQKGHDQDGRRERILERGRGSSRRLSVFQAVPARSERDRSGAKVLVLRAANSRRDSDLLPACRSKCRKRSLPRFIPK